jgi:hypothetical protein
MDSRPISGADRTERPVASVRVGGIVKTATSDCKPQLVVITSTSHPTEDALDGGVAEDVAALLHRSQIDSPVMPPMRRKRSSLLKPAYTTGCAGATASAPDGSRANISG